MSDEPIEDDSDVDEEFDPPTLERVRDRAWAISSVVCRAFAETFDDRAEAATLHSRLLTWVEDIGLRGEFEDEELELVEADLGSLDQQLVVNGTWRSEGLVVLAWALGRGEMPPHDELGHPSEVATSVFFLAEDASSRAEELTLRNEEELGEFAAIQLGLHWRLRDFSLRPEAMDFAEFARDSWFGGFPLNGIELVDGDLAINGVAIAEAAPEDVGRCQSTAMERHRAINWLRGWHPVYSEVDTST